MDAGRLWALKARYVFPVASPPIREGTITVHGERIAAVGENRSGRPAIDLGNAALLPGLCNAHTHLEFSNLRSPLGEAGMALPEWIRRVIAWRRENPAEPATAISSGLHESAHCGVTTLGEIATTGYPLAASDRLQGLDVTVFRELIGLRPERTAGLVALASQHIAEGGKGGYLAGLSPHAPYSVHPAVVQQVVEISRTARAPVAMHLAESPEELELLRSGSGPFVSLLKELDAWDPQAIPPCTRPLEYLRLLSRAHRALVIHGNYLADDEIRFLADHADRMTVVYCPRTQAYFRHAPYPLKEMLDSGVAMALGTDSRASNPDLDLWAEMRWVVMRYPSFSPERVLRLGTVDGARALGRDHETGSLLPGKLANLALVALPDHETEEAHELLFDSDRPLLAAIFRGQWTFGRKFGVPDV